MRKVLYRAAIVVALAAAAVTGVTTSSAGAAPAHHAHAIGQYSNPAPVPADWWW